MKRRQEAIDRWFSWRAIQRSWTKNGRNKETLRKTGTKRYMKKKQKKSLFFLNTYGNEWNYKKYCKQDSNTKHEVRYQRSVIPRYDDKTHPAAMPQIVRLAGLRSVLSPLNCCCSQPSPWPGEVAPFRVSAIGKYWTLKTKHIKQ